MFRILFIYLLNVVDEPIAQKIEHLKGLRHPSRPGVSEERLDLGYELSMHLLMGRQAGIIRFSHEFLFLLEMGAGVLEQFADGLADNLLPLAYAHGAGELVDDGKQFFVLLVELVNFDAVGIAPGKQRHGILPLGLSAAFALKMNREGVGRGDAALSGSG
jgi:hypothetical protein